MEEKISKITGIVTVLIMVILMDCFAQDKSPVRIEFDEDSKRTEMITGRELPYYKYAQKGSFQFFLSRLDEPDNFINYFHDGLRRVYIKELALMRKEQERFAIWALVWKNGRGLHPTYGPRIHHLAVSFIPLATSTGKPERRVYLVLNDLKLIDWGTDQ
ncbi:hypothetical protein ACFL4V_02115 [Candidatus Latescibacterota bacterium]